MDLHRTVGHFARLQSLFRINRRPAGRRDRRDNRNKGGAYRCIAPTRGMEVRPGTAWTDFSQYGIALRMLDTRATRACESARVF